MSLIGVLRRRPRLSMAALTVTVPVTVGLLEAADLWWRRVRLVRADPRLQRPRVLLNAC